MKTLNFPPVPVFAIEDNPKAQALKVLEEAGEFVEAFKSFNEDPTKEALSHFMEEAADVNQALMNALHALNITQETIDDAAIFCFGRNFARGRFDDSDNEDIIEQDTCTCNNLSENSDRFICSECGLTMVLADQISYIMWDGKHAVKDLLFCPNCGAKVISNDD